MTTENFLRIAFLLIVLVVTFQAWKSRQAKAIAQQQAKQADEAEQILSRTLASTNYNLDVADLHLTSWLASARWPFSQERTCWK
jgi:hypothetical protein